MQEMFTLISNSNSTHWTANKKKDFIITTKWADVYMMLKHQNFKEQIDMSSQSKSFHDNNTVRSIVKNEVEFFVPSKSLFISNSITDIEKYHCFDQNMNYFYSWIEYVTLSTNCLFINELFFMNKLVYI